MPRLTTAIPPFRPGALWARVRTGVRGFRLKPPLPGDLRLVAVLMVLNAIPYAFHMNGITWGTGRWLLEVGSILPLMWRRTHPVVAGICTGLVTLVVTSNVHPAQPYPYAVLVAGYTLGAETRGWTRRFLIGTYLLGDLTAEFLHGQQDHADDYFITFLTSITAMLLGVLMQTQRAYAQAMEERAAALERDRAEGIARAAAAERARIARDMHDVVGHAVALMVVQAEAGPLYLRSDPDKAEKAFDAISATGRDAMGQLRRLLGVLKAEGGAGAGSGSGAGSEDGQRAPQPTLGMLDDLVEQVRTSGLAVALTSAGTPVPLAADAETAAYRVVQEALTNTMKHAGAARSDITLEWSAAGLRITVADDGRGCAGGGEGRDEAGNDAGGGHGLVGLSERLAAVGGSLEVPAVQVPGARRAGGFAVAATIPAARSASAG